jgi:hypothetical protein
MQNAKCKMQNAKCKGVSKRGSDVWKSLSMLFLYQKT